MNCATLSGGSIGKAFAAVENAEGSGGMEEMVRSLIDASLSRSLSEVMEVSDALSALGRDRQKLWCVTAEEFIRKIFIMQQGLSEIAFADTDETEYIQQVMPKIKPTFYSRAFAAIDSAMRLVDANVSAKLIFADLGNRFYLYI